jgi:hypothetical protein
LDKLGKNCTPSAAALKEYTGFNVYRVHKKLKFSVSKEILKNLFAEAKFAS